MPPYQNKRDFSQYPAQTNSFHFDPNQKDPDDQEADFWRPSPEAFAAFAKKDFELGIKNVRHALLNAGRPITAKEIKESSLHSLDCIERVLSSGIASSTILETKGRYSLVKP